MSPLERPAKSAAKSSPKNPAKSSPKNPPRTPARRSSGPLRVEAIGQALEEVCARCDPATRREHDPVRFLHRFSDPLDQEIVGTLAASLAFGNVKAFAAKIEIVLGLMGPHPASFADDSARLRRGLRDFRYRFCTGEDLSALIIGARTVQVRHGSLGRAFRAALDRTAGDLRAALGIYTKDLREAGGLSAIDSHGAKHLLPDPDAGSANKRMMLFLRWMVRPSDGIDLGLWDLSPSILMMPVDVHVHKLGKNLGMTARNQASWRAAEDITAALRELDPSDPTRYDFALCHLGMLQRCPSARDPVRCSGCPIQPLCVHWMSHEGAPPRGRAR